MKLPLILKKKREAVLRKDWQMEVFREALEDCHLSDLGFVGYRNTWSNKRQDGGFNKERLNRAIANQSWYDLFDLHCARTCFGN